MKKQYSDFDIHAPILVKNNKNLWLFHSHSLHQLIMEPARTTEHCKMVKHHIITNLSEKVIQSGVIEMGISDHGLNYSSEILWKN